MTSRAKTSHTVQMIASLIVALLIVVVTISVVTARLGVGEDSGGGSDSSEDGRGRGRGRGRSGGDGRVSAGSALQIAAGLALWSPATARSDGKSLQGTQDVEMSPTERSFPSP